MRNRSEPDQVTSAGFEPARIAVTRRVIGCYREPARSARLWRTSQEAPPNEKRRKASQRERAFRGGHEVSAGPVKTFRKAGDATNGTAGLRAKRNLRVKRRDPWHGANARPKAVADPALSGQDAENGSQTCLGLVRKPVAQPPAQAS